MRVKILDNEYWYGGIVDKGLHMPLDKHSDFVLDMTDVCASLDQSNPLILSTRGRYLWSEKPFSAIFREGEIVCEGQSEVLVSEGHENLKGAYLAACRRHFPFSGRLPNEAFFRMPQYNTWIELQYNQTQQGVLDYAHGIIDHGLPAGILMIDDGWSEDYGVWQFHKGKFSDPKGMIDELHKLGFKVMLWVIPVVSPDCATFRELRKKDYLVKDKDGKIAVREWWNGLSAVLDLTNAGTWSWLKEQLDDLQEVYGIDGFKFDGGDAYFYTGEDQAAEQLLPQEYTSVYNRFALQYDFNELRSAYGFGGQALVTRLQDKQHSWDKSGLNCLIPNSLVQGLLGYAYHCPDMIGGGDVGSDYTRIDEELIVRYAQVSALMPMMQFSLAPWRVLSEKNRDIVRKAALLHVKFSDYIMELACHACTSGEPIIRHMAYEFPEEGFETISDQFMLGDTVLVAPVLIKNMNERIVRLPKGKWQAADGNVYDGDTDICVKVTVEELPYFIRNKA